MSDADRLDALLGELRGFVRERAWEPFHDPKNLAMAIASEAGELAAELRWIRNDDADAHCRGPARAAVVDELADVLTLALFFADRIGVDPIEAIRQKLEKTRAKYPAELSRGKAEPPASTS